MFKNRFDLVTDINQLQSTNQGMADYRYERISTINNFTDSGATVKFYGNDMIFEWTYNNNQGWFPDRTFLLYKYLLAQNDYTTALTQNLGIGPNMNICAALYDKCKFEINDQTIDEISENLPQIDTLRQRLSQDGNFLNTLMKDMNFFQADINERINEVSSDGALVGSNISSTAVSLNTANSAAVGLNIGAGAAQNTFDINYATGVVSFNQGVGVGAIDLPDLTDILTVGDVFVYRENAAQQLQQATITNVAAATITCQFDLTSDKVIDQATFLREGAAANNINFAADLWSYDHAGGALANRFLILNDAAGNDVVFGALGVNLFENATKVGRYILIGYNDNDILAQVEAVNSGAGALVNGFQIDTNAAAKLGNADVAAGQALNLHTGTVVKTTDRINNVRMVRNPTGLTVEPSFLMQGAFASNINDARQLKIFQGAWRPPLSLFYDYYKYIPGGSKCRLTLSASANYRIRAIESLGVATEGAGNQYGFNVLDSKLYVAKCETKRVPNTTHYFLDLRPIKCNVVDVTALNFENTVNIKASIEALTVAFQDNSASSGMDSRYSITKFKERAANELALEQFYVNYAGVQHPQPSFEFSYDAANNTDTLSEVFYRNIVNAGKLYSGSTETLTEWRKRGIYLLTLLIKDGSEKSPDLTIKSVFNSAASVANMNQLIFEHYKSIVKVEMENGRVIRVEKVDA